MEYAKKTVILKGDHQGIFTMQRSGATKYSLSWTSEPAPGDLFVFDEDNFYRLPAKNGVLPIDITQVCAIAVGENFASKGQLRPFNWAKARGMVAAQKKRNRETIERNAISKAHEPRASMQGNSEAKLKDMASETPCRNHDSNACSANGEAIKGQVAQNTGVKIHEAEPPKEKEEVQNIIEEDILEEPEIADQQGFEEENISQELVNQEVVEKDTIMAEDRSMPPCENEPIPLKGDMIENNYSASGPMQKESRANAQKADISSQKHANPLDQCPMAELPVDVCPFMRDFPQSQWKRHEFPSARGKWHYLTGELYQDGKPYATALALPGSPNVRPGGNGFNTYRIAGDGRGYWIRITRI